MGFYFNDFVIDSIVLKNNNFIVNLRINYKIQLYFIKVKKKIVVKIGIFDDLKKILFYDVFFF